MSAWELVAKLQELEVGAKKAREELELYANDVDEFENEVLTHAELRKALKKADRELEDLRERNRLMVADKTEITRMIDEACGWSSDSRHAMAKKFKENGSGALGALRLFLRLYKKSLEGQ